MAVFCFLWARGIPARSHHTALRFEQWTDILNLISHSTRSLICIMILAEKVGWDNKVAAKGATIIYDDPWWYLYQIHTFSTALRIYYGAHNELKTYGGSYAAKCFLFLRLTIFAAQWRVVRLLTLNGDVSTNGHSVLSLAKALKFPLLSLLFLFSTHQLQLSTLKVSHNCTITPVTFFSLRHNSLTLVSLSFWSWEIRSLLFFRLIKKWATPVILIQVHKK